jgi:hypothetical protein
MADSINSPLVPIAAQIASAERELKFRLRVYPRWIVQNKMSQATANHELAAMRAIIDTLQQVARGERLI